MRRLPTSVDPRAMGGAPDLGVAPLSLEHLPAEEQNPVAIKGSRQAEVPPALRVGMRSRFMRAHETILPSAIINDGSADHSMPDMRAAADLASSMRALAMMMSASAVRSPASIYAAHAEELERYIPLYGYYGGWDLALPNQRAHAGELPDQAFFNELASACASAPSTGVQPKRVVTVGTNHGWPSFLSSPDDHLLHFAMAAECLEQGSLAATERVARDAARFAGLTGAMREPVFNTMSRTGFLRKELTYYSWDIRGRLCPVVRARGYSCRRRRVMGAPTWINEIARADIMATTAALKRSRLGALFHHRDSMHTGAKIAKMLASARSFDASATVFSDDAAAFDDSCSLALIKRALDSMPLSALTRQVLAWQDDVSGILQGPLHRDDDAFVADRLSGLMSGTIPTTLLGSWINWSVACSCYAAGLGLTPRRMIEWMERGRAFVLVQGDDTLNIGPRPDPEAYVEEGRRLGFERSLSPHPIFLKVWYGGRMPHTLASRAAMASSTRERRAAGECHELLGALPRWWAARADPAFNTFFREQARANPLWRRFRIEKFADLLSVVSERGFVHQLNHERREARMSDATWGAAIHDALGYQVAETVLGDGDDDPAYASDDSEPSALSAWARLLVERVGALGADFESSQTHTHLLREGGSLDWRKYLQQKASARALRLAQMQG